MSAARILTFEVMTSRESTLNFDRREMLIVHDVFRREFALMPGLIGTVAPGDRDRAGLVGDHIDGLTSLLHHHHHGEDTNVWPVLVDRCADAAAHTGSMHDQHEQLATDLGDVHAALGVWRVDASAASGHRLFDALIRTLASLRQHLDDEERHVVPLLEQHISAAEWDALVQEGSADADQAQLPLMFGTDVRGRPRDHRARAGRDARRRAAGHHGHGCADVRRAFPRRPRHPHTAAQHRADGEPTCLITDTI